MSGEHTRDWVVGLLPDIVRQLPAGFASRPAEEVSMVPGSVAVASEIVIPPALTLTSRFAAGVSMVAGSAAMVARGKVARRCS